MTSRFLPFSLFPSKQAVSLVAIAMYMLCDRCNGGLVAICGLLSVRLLQRAVYEAHCLQALNLESGCDRMAPALDHDCQLLLIRLLPRDNRDGSPNPSSSVQKTTFECTCKTSTTSAYLSVAVKFPRLSRDYNLIGQQQLAVMLQGGLVTQSIQLSRSEPADGALRTQVW